MNNTETLREYGLITAGSVLIAAAVGFFMVPGDLVLGSVAGLAMVLSQVLPLRVATLNMMTILTKTEYAQLMAYVRRTDPDAFLTVTAVSEVAGTWNTRGHARRI